MSTMKVGAAAVVVLVMAAAAAVVGRGETVRGDVKNPGLFAPLKKGTAVSLKEKDGAWEIGVGPTVTPGRKVFEVGADYVVIQDVTGLEQVRIPIYAVRAVRVSLLGGGS